MRCVVQRVKEASVTVAGETVGKIGPGYMVLIGVSVEDTEKDVRYMADKVPNLRIFEDAEDKMNLSLKDVGGEILAVSQFTLYGDARGGRRPSFIAAARPEAAKRALRAAGSQLARTGHSCRDGAFPHAHGGRSCQRRPGNDFVRQYEGILSFWGRGRFSERSASPPDPHSRRAAGK